MKLIDDFNDEIQRLQEEIADNHRFEYKEKDLPDNIKALQQKINIQIPGDLENLLIRDGAFYHQNFGDVWQTLEIYSAVEMLSNTAGLLDFIEYAWGGRDDLLAHFNSDEQQQLNLECIVVGYRYVDDNVHDYLYFSKPGHFGHLLFDQDSQKTAISELRAILRNNGTRYSFDELIRQQLNEIVEGAELSIQLDRAV